MVKCCDITTGMLRTPFTIERKAQTANGSGGLDEVWSTHATGFGAFKALSGFERLQSDRLDAQTSNRLTMRYLSTIKDKDRVDIGGRKYNIRFINNVEMGNRWHVLDLDGGVAT